MRTALAPCHTRATCGLSAARVDDDVERSLATSQDAQTHSSAESTHTQQRAAEWRGGTREPTPATAPTTTTSTTATLARIDVDAMRTSADGTDHHGRRRRERSPQIAPHTSTEGSRPTTAAATTSTTAAATTRDDDDALDSIDRIDVDTHPPLRA